MTEVLLVRHGQSEHNKREEIQGQIDSPLTDKGRRQAEKLRDHLSGRNFDRVYSSDLQRASETAEIVSERQGVEVEETEKLRERNLGELEGQPLEAWEELDAEDTHEWSVENGESLKEHRERANEVLDEILEKELENALIVTHGGTIAALLTGILNCKSRQGWRFSIGSCSITEIAHIEQRWTIEKVSDSCHLD